MRLTDSFMELIAYVSYFKKSAANKQPSFEKVKADIQRLLSQSEEHVKKNNLSQDDYNQARFAVCAWIDESILNSSWREKNKWQREQLQRIYFNTTDAGEEFFKRLNTLGIHQRDVREIYYLCLAMGFMGRYCDEKDKYLLDQLKTSNLKVLIGSSVGLPSLERMELFPEAYPPETEDSIIPKKRSGFSLYTILCIAAPVALFGILYLIYSFILSGIGENFLSMVP